MNKPATMIWLVALLWTLPFSHTSAARQQSDSSALLAQGDQYATEGKLIQARDSYEQAIAKGASLENDPVRSLALGLWYMNAEPHDYRKAAGWLEAALRMNPDDGIRLSLAQALSWSGQYRPAIEHYQQLVRNKPEDRSVKLQLARVLSWSRNFSESLTIYDQLQSSSPNDIEILIERARVLSWSGRYNQATQTYSEALKQDPQSVEAKVGQAQVLYWSGHSDAALCIAREVLKQQPTNREASYLMAALEHDRGQNGRALDYLRHAYPDKDTDALRRMILREMRPVLDMRFGFANDREEPDSGVNSTYRTLRYSGSLAFNLTHNVRMEVSNTVTENDTSTTVLSQLGADSLATQTVGRLHFSITPWLRLGIGAGVGTTGEGEYEGVKSDRQYQWLYDFHPVITHGGWNLDFSFTRTIADYTPLAVHLNLIQRREDVAAAYTFGKRVRLGGEYWYGDYTLDDPTANYEQFKTHAQGGSASFLPIIYSTERFAIEAGVRYEIFRFADGTATFLDPVNGFESTGIFTPRLYERYAGTGHVRWTPHRRFRLDLDGTYGPQRIFGFPSLDPPPADWGDTGSLSVHLTIPTGAFEPYVEYDFFSTATPASPGLREGMFSSHYLLAGLRLRF